MLLTMIVSPLTSGLWQVAPAGNCHYPHVKGLTIVSNSIYNGWRMEDVWLDK